MVAQLKNPFGSVVRGWSSEYCVARDLVKILFNKPDLLYNVYTPVKLYDLKRLGFPNIILTHSAAEQSLPLQPLTTQPIFGCL